MQNELGTISVREQLIIAGMEELEAHGIADFSLRRVATSCNVSCAAPYKHFESKEKLIDEIFNYIRTQLDLLLEQVAEISLLVTSQAAVTVSLHLSPFLKLFA